MQIPIFLPVFVDSVRMASRSLLSSQIGVASRHVRRPVRQHIRLLASEPPSKQPEPVVSLPNPSSKEQSWLTHRVKGNPALYAIFLGFARALGYGSPKQLANRRALHLYNTLCATRADQEADFWRKGIPARFPFYSLTHALRNDPSECALPPTFQSWFTVTNLHVWLLTVRLRALPAPHGLNHIQGLIDHYFQDVEERVRAVLQPGVLPPRLTSDASLTPSSSPETKHRAELSKYVSPYPNNTFYTFPSPVPPPDTFLSPAAYAKAEKRARAPESLITRHMKIFREQWAGLGMSMDLGLVKGDAEMAAAIWRNLLGGRGARGISLTGAGANPSPSEAENTSKGFRRSVNLVGGLVENVEKIDFDVEETRDDLSGVYDFGVDESER
jgi:cytochrome b pre-mRNA-processing protein 3